MYTIRVTEEALRAVPESYREASTAMGATKWQTIWNVLLPSSLPTLMTGVTLVAGLLFIFGMFGLRGWCPMPKVWGKNKGLSQIYF